MDQCKTIKFLEENIRKILCDLKLVKDFFRYDTQNTVYVYKRTN